MKQRPAAKKIFPFWLAICMAAGCSFAPDVPETAAEPAGDVWPQLLPAQALAELGDAASEEAPLPQEEQQRLEEAASSLRAQGDVLMTPVLTEAERERMRAAVNSP